MEKFKKLGLWILLFITYFILNIYVSTFIYCLHIENLYLKNIAYIIGEICIAALLIYLYRKDFKGKFKELKTKEGTEKIKQSICIWILGLGVMIASNLLLSPLVGSDATNETSNRVLLYSYTIYSVFSMVLIAPVCEEIVFRLSPAKMIDNNVLYVMFSAVIFGFAHVVGESGYQLLYIIPYAALGASFAYIYRKFDNILLSILMHTIHNLICVMIVFSL